VLRDPLSPPQEENCDGQHSLAIPANREAVRHKFSSCGGLMGRAARVSSETSALIISLRIRSNLSRRDDSLFIWHLLNLTRRLELI